MQPAPQLRSTLPRLPETAGAPTAAQLRQSLNVIVSTSLRRVAAGLALLYGGLALLHPFVMPRGAGGPMSLFAALTAVALLLLLVRLGRSPAPPKQAHPMAVGMLALVLANSLLHLTLVPSPLQSTNVVLTILGAGCFLLSGR